MEVIRVKMSQEQRVSGKVDRVVGNVVVVIVQDPNDPHIFKEIYVPKDQFQQKVKEGDTVTVITNNGK